MPRQPPIRVCKCGNEIGKNRWRSGKRDCSTCGIVRGIRVAREMHEKTGATYEHWRSQVIKSLLTNDSNHGGSEDANSGECGEHH